MKIRTLTSSANDQWILNAILSEPELHNRITEDDTPQLQYTTTDGSVYFFVTVEGEPAGIVQAKQLTRFEVDIHMNFLEEHRASAFKASKEVFEMLSDYFDWEVLTARIPAVFEDVIGFTLKFGFKYAGTIPQCYAKGGELVDVNIYYYGRR